MKTRLFSALDHAIERKLPEQRLFLKSEDGTRFIRLRPTMQAGIIFGGAAIASWTFVVTAIFLMDTIGAGNAREQGQRERAIYEARLNALSNERDDRAVEASAAYDRFYVALEQISDMQSSLLASEDRRNELETGIEVIQTTLRKTMKDRDDARHEADNLTAQISGEENPDAPLLARAKSTNGSVSFLTAALEQTAAERDQIARDAKDAIDAADELRFTLKMNDDRNDQIFTRLEEAVTVSMAPLDKMFRDAGMPTESILREVRSGYSGQGGPLLPATMSTSGGAAITDKTSKRANQLLKNIDRINLFRIAADKSPVAMPVKSAFRMSSPFGYRKNPTGPGSRMHAGVDFASKRGTPIYATADGVVTYAGWQSAYGKLVKIKHAFGIETRYAHNSKIRVKVGQKVSRGDLISDMGATGRVTGNHVHYEVRLNGTPVNPMTYIKAGRDVF